MKALTFLTIVLFFGCHSLKKEEKRAITKPIDLNQIKLVENLICQHIGLLEMGNLKLEDSGWHLIDKKIYEELDSIKKIALHKCLEEKGIFISVEEIKLPSNKHFFQAGAWYDNGKPKISFASIMYSGNVGSGNSWEYDLIKLDTHYYVDTSSKKIGWID